ncbi:uncharacterized protein CELE_D1081.11 [Caenorhabditis elegans]|uniref:Uncharacterized protein n=1 Tax=Caenorhabditis elegans TaxID=6239 RepID=A7YKU9_CAEEL|nr:Uncharacterized protein CELE_D1081.11 [Caenorhabditis elegans]CAP03129.1 Uncharacterized protein CELE_D1081.11 [Caenorhabditis elegans]|eukprot:NP_001122437.1 Uncharacterized protein CELE_D1081.11 [Caenorhabditis elegans]
MGLRERIFDANIYQPVWNVKHFVFAAAFQCEIALLYIAAIFHPFCGSDAGNINVIRKAFWDEHLSEFLFQLLYSFCIGFCIAFPSRYLYGLLCILELIMSGGLIVYPTIIWIKFDGTDKRAIYVQFFRTICYYLTSMNSAYIACVLFKVSVLSPPRTRSSYVISKNSSEKRQDSQVTTTGETSSQHQKPA